jgi:hypothetical protein
MPDANRDYQEGQEHGRLDAMESGQFDTLIEL